MTGTPTRGTPVEETDEYEHYITVVRLAREWARDARPRMAAYERGLNVDELLRTLGVAHALVVRALERPAGPHEVFALLRHLKIELWNAVGAENQQS